VREIVLVRHGETTGNSAMRLNGATDVPLSDLGKRQGRRAGEALAGEHFDQLVVSPMTRARQTGALVAPSLAPSAMVIADFREVDFGRWETWTWEEVAARDPEGLAQYRAHPERGYPGGDTLEGFRARVGQAAREELAQLPGRTVATLHKGVIRGILAALLDRPREEFATYPVELGCIHRLRETPGGWEVEGPLVDHLGPDRVPGT
jgi:broad specificity phosphatase PhoE